MITIDEYSAATVPISMTYNETLLSTGTAFFYKHEEEIYLATNWHNLTGINPGTEAHLSPMGGEPDQITAMMPIDGKLGQWKPCVFDLFDKSGQPLWREHPTLRRRADVVALPILCPEGFTTYPINMMTEASNMRVDIGQDVFILGYPFTLTGAGALPVWKRGSIASEPEIEIDDVPKFMVDTASRSGMSGSPVICRSWGSYLSVDGTTTMGTGQYTKFIGIYSGRVGADDELKAQLGMVWRASLIPEIIAGNARGSK